jgi:hypothetical protein
MVHSISTPSPWVSTLPLYLATMLPPYPAMTTLSTLTLEEEFHDRFVITFFPHALYHMPIMFSAWCIPFQSHPLPVGLIGTNVGLFMYR